MTREIHIYDKTSPAGELRLYLLKGDHGAMTFTVWVKRDFPDVELATGIDYHSLRPLYDYNDANTPSQKLCKWLNAPCWSDGSSLAADGLWRRCNHGRDEDVIWRELLEWYDVKLGADPEQETKDEY